MTSPAFSLCLPSTNLNFNSEPYVRYVTVIVTITWTEVYLKDGKVTNVSVEGENLYSFVAEC